MKSDNFGKKDTSVGGKTTTDRTNTQNTQKDRTGQTAYNTNTTKKPTITNQQQQQKNKTTWGGSNLPRDKDKTDRQ